jgi:16S rRNA (cytidine1402-2'-O)-methyltransferase
VGPEVKQLSAGLYVVATPIGTARDITLRALDILASADLLVAEDTRTCRHLMEIHGIALNGRKVLAYHDHSGERTRDRILETIRDGRSVAYTSEAGTPLVADPGFALVRAAAAAGLPVTAAPGASAALTALVLSGLPSDRFLFAGFPPPKAAERRRVLAGLVSVPATLVLFESPKRIHGLLDDLVQTAGDGRHVAVCRELTKRFETVHRGTLAEVRAVLDGQPQKGEIVVVLDRASGAAPEIDVEAELRQAMERMTVRDAADVVAAAAGLPRRQVYQLALKLGGRS